MPPRRAPVPEVPDVGVVILNWNAAELTRRCVRSLLHTDHPTDHLHVVVVDNASIDGSVPALRASFPDLHLVEHPHNVGFAEGCNVGIRALGPVDLVALVNNDATVDPGWLRASILAMRSGDDVGAVAPKMLFAWDYATIAVEPVVPGGARSRLRSVHSGGLDVTGAAIADGEVVAVADPTEPLRVHRELGGPARIHVPVGGPSRAVAVELDADHTLRATWDGGATVLEPRAGLVRLELDGTGLPTHRRINNLGTSLTDWGEGLELAHGEEDRADLRSTTVPGWCGGAVLLHADYLRDVGLFDPTFFAYYEDSDLSWRGRRRGWRTVTAPGAVVHHLHGASAGPTWAGFFLLNYRNWLLTVLRNGGPGQIGRALRVAWRLAWGPTRRNVVGRLRRGRRPDPAITRAWWGVAVGVLRQLPRVAATRSAARSTRVGVLPAGAPPPEPPGRPAPRAPRPRPGGPVVVFVDVTETLRAGWRAGIQRVVTELVTALDLLADERVEVVEVCWSPLDGAYRRLTRTERERLAAPPPMRNHPPAVPPPPPAWRRALGPLSRGARATAAKERVRRRRALRHRPPEEAQLVLDRFPAGSVFFDPDASWNLVDAPRSSLLAQLRADRVTVVCLLHDLLPDSHPDWFDPNLVRVFREHLAAHTLHADLVICNSQHTRKAFAAYCEQQGVPEPRTSVVAFGSEVDRAAASSDDALLEALDGRRYLLVVGTLEPRKNHELLLDAFDRIADRHEDLDLVVVGRQGWRIERLAERIRTHPAHGARLHWPAGVDDGLLAALYDGAFAVVVPSLTEGFGLPVIEALRHGCVVLSSDGGALPEAGGDLVEYFDPTDVDALVALVERHLGDPDHHAAVRARVAGYRAPTWAACAEQCATDIVAAHANRLTRR